MKQFLAISTKDKILTKCQSLKMMPNEPIQAYIDKFWDLYLKATVFKQIDFAKKTNINFMRVYPKK